MVRPGNPKVRTKHPRRGKASPAAREKVMNGHLPVACDLGAFTGAEKARHSELADILRGAVVRVDEIDHGFAATISDGKDLNDALKEWVRLEAKCCPFLRFDVSDDRDGHAHVVKIMGPTGTREFLRAHYGFGEKPG